MKKFVLLALMLGTQLAFAGGSLDGTWTTNYIPGQGKQTMEIKGDCVVIKDDQNTCSLNAIGEPLGCTRMAAVEQHGILKSDLQTSRRFPRGTMIYKIEGTSFGIVYFRSPISEWIRLLKYDERGNVIYAASMISQ